MNDIIQLLEGENLGDLQDQMNALQITGYIPLGNMVIVPYQSVTSGMATTISQYSYFQAMILKLSFEWNYIYQQYGYLY